MHPLKFSEGLFSCHGKRVLIKTLNLLPCPTLDCMVHCCCILLEAVAAVIG